MEKERFVHADVHAALFHTIKLMMTRDCQAKIAKTTINLFKSYFVVYVREKFRFVIT